MGAVDFVTVLLRALGFVAIVQAAGIVLFGPLYGRELERSAPQIAGVGRYAAGAGLLLTLVYQLLQPARLAGGFAGVLDLDLHAVLLASDAGTATAVRLVGLVLVLLPCGKQGGRGREVTGVVGATLIAVSFALMGHTATDDRRWLLAPLVVLHVGIAAFWFGVLLPFRVALEQDAPQDVAVALERFSGGAVWLVPLIFFAGVAMAAVLLPDWGALRRPYGLLLVVKVAAFAALMGFAAANKWRWAARLRAAETDGATQALRWSLLAEWVLIAGVLAVTAVMTGLYSPE